MVEVLLSLWLAAATWGSRWLVDPRRSPIIHSHPRSMVSMPHAGIRQLACTHTPAHPHAPALQINTDPFKGGWIMKIKMSNKVGGGVAASAAQLGPGGGRAGGRSWAGGCALCSAPLCAGGALSNGWTDVGWCLSIGTLPAILTPP